MAVPRYTSGALVVRFLIKKLIVFALLMVAMALFFKSPLTYGYPWLIAMFVLWCVLDVAGPYGEVKAHAELREALSAARDPEPLVEVWLERDTLLQKVDGLMTASFGAGILLLGYPIGLGAFGLVAGLIQLIPAVAGADRRDINRMVTHTLPPRFPGRE